MKAKSLQELGAIARRLSEQQAQNAAEEKRRAEAQRKADAEKNLFVRAAGDVQPLRVPARVTLRTDQPAAIPVQRQLDEARVLRESISDEFDFTTLLDADDAMSFRREGVGTDVTRKLRKGDWAIQREVDLHGLRRDEAREALATFIRDANRQGLRCVRVVHGKGHGSPGKAPVLKGKVQGWLIQKSEVLAFVQAKPAEGGGGALVVLLKPA